MKNLKALLLSTAIILVSGCSLTGESNPQDVVKDMMNNMQNLTASTFDITSNIKQNDTDLGTSVDADIMVKGKSDNSDQEIPNLKLEISADIQTTDAEKGDLNGNAKFMLTITNGEFFFKLDALTLPEELQAQVASFVSLYQGNWYKFPNELLPEDIQAQIGGDDIDEAKTESVKKLISNANLFDIIESSNSNGQYVYKTAINQDNLKNLSREMGKLEGQPVAEADLESLDVFFENYTHDIVLYINKSSKFLDKVDFSVLSKEDNDNLELSLTATFSDHNQKQAITAPADAQVFNPMSLMGLGMMLEGSQGVSLNEDAGDIEDLDLSQLEGMSPEDLEQLETDLQEFEASMGELPVME